jgi:hypothetical protein
MQPRLETLVRLLTLYAAAEEMHLAELQRMTVAVHESQQAIKVEREVARSARVKIHEALLVGDHMSRTMAETQQEAAASRRRVMELIHARREELSDAAMEQYVASRLRREQIKRVFDDVAARTEIEERRRLQAASDDRFLARKQWTEAREKTRIDSR